MMHLHRQSHTRWRTHHALITRPPASSMPVTWVAARAILRTPSRLSWSRFRRRRNRRRCSCKVDLREVVNTITFQRLSAIHDGPDLFSRMVQAGAAEQFRACFTVLERSAWGALRHRARQSSRAGVRRRRRHAAGISLLFPGVGWWSAASNGYGAAVGLQGMPALHCHLPRLVPTSPGLDFHAPSRSMPFPCNHLVLP